MAVEPHLRALVHAAAPCRRPCSTRRRTRASAARSEAAARRRSTSRARASSYVFRLFAFQSARVSVVSVKQPTETRLRTTHGVSVERAGGEHDAAADHVRRSRARRNPQQTSGRKRSRELPRIARPSTTPERAREPERPVAAVRAATRQDDRRGEQLVEDLAVVVDVVPDEVRVQRRDDRRDEPRPPRDEPPADLVDEQRRRDRDARSGPARPRATTGRRSSRSGSGRRRTAAASTRTARRG